MSRELAVRSGRTRKSSIMAICSSTFSGSRQSPERTPQRIPFLIEVTRSVPEFAPDGGGVVLETLKLPGGTQDAHGHG